MNDPKTACRMINAIKLKANSRILLICVLVLFFGYSAVPARPNATASRLLAVKDVYYRTELYFGRSIPGGGMVSDAEWDKFLADFVTPRFPNGFTILKAMGQYREMDGKIDKEPSEVLIFLYSAKSKTSSRRKIEEIRRSYVKQFKQEAVLRMDLPSTVRVLF